MQRTSENILCPHCNVAVKEYHRHCPYCGGELARKITVRVKRFAWWQAAIIATPFAALLSIYLPLNSDYLEYLLPLQFIACALGITVVIYLLANIILYAVFWIRNG